MPAITLPSRFQFASSTMLHSLSRLSATTPAKAHWEHAKNCQGISRWAHRTVAVLEFLPIAGHLVALIEKVMLFAYNRLRPLSGVRASTLDSSKELASTKATKELTKLFWEPKTRSSEERFVRMQRNATKALEEHRRTMSSVEGLPDPYPVSLPTSTSPFSPVEIQHSSSSKQGTRSTMEDEHFFLSFKEGTLAAVLDGHSGCEVPKFASEQFQIRFPSFLQQFQGDVGRAFEITIDSIQKDIVEKIMVTEEFLDHGSTATVCFICAKTGLVYTANMGDSEARLYRTCGNRDSLEVYPLSCVRDWSSSKDVARLVKNYERLATGPNASWYNAEAQRVKQWENSKHPKLLYAYEYVNVSRAFGDYSSGLHSAYGGYVIHKPKISVFQSQPGDRIVIGCDGLWDYVQEHEVQNLVQNSADKATLAEQLVNFALDEKKSSDNVSVLCLRIQ